MLEPGKEVVRSSDEVELSQALDRVRRIGLFEPLERIYASFPDTTCDGCARCCFESPGVFYLEYLYLVDLLAGSSTPLRERMLRRAFRELFFSWVDPRGACIFLNSGGCTAYERRPLACRLFGLIRPAERDRAEAEARLAARRDAARLRRLGIEIPEEVVRRSLVSCERVRDLAGRPVTVDGEAMAAQVARLDAVLLPRQVVVQEFCFSSLPERVGATALGADVVDAMRLQLLRRARRGEEIEHLVEMLLDRARLPASLGTTREDPR